MGSTSNLEDYYDLLGYMLSSAKGVVIDPKIYGPFRIVDAASRLIVILETQGVADDFMVSLRHFIDEGKFSVITDEAEFARFLDDLVVKVAMVTRDAGER